MNWPISGGMKKSKSGIAIIGAAADSDVQIRWLVAGITIAHLMSWVCTWMKSMPFGKSGRARDSAGSYWRRSAFFFFDLKSPMGCSVIADYSEIVEGCSGLFCRHLIS
ncbi:hypothetical protein CEXT_450501 [Caerostris extrusa]|uniref:Uncharacterized protein n=1 Tax=Caerostris extrusa TaxID=172846 RepID=A0AAV4NQN4_CAEEX|nr:hypothetical protein CEXT_450501 [Caerostris extrusa]